MFLSSACFTNVFLPEALTHEYSDQPGAVTRARCQKANNQRLVAQRHHCYQAFFVTPQTRQSRRSSVAWLQPSSWTSPAHVQVDALLLAESDLLEGDPHLQHDQTDLPFRCLRRHFVLLNDVSAGVRVTLALTRD